MHFFSLLGLAIQGVSAPLVDGEYSQMFTPFWDIYDLQTYILMPEESIKVIYWSSIHPGGQESPGNVHPAI